MSDIDEDDWRRIYEAFKKRRPDGWLDRSLVVGEMVALYCAEPRCAHLRLEHEASVESLHWCPKGCSGYALDVTIKCRDCGAIVYQIAEGHEGCKYGR